jgi:hypothetical protein
MKRRRLESEGVIDLAEKAVTSATQGENSVSIVVVSTDPSAQCSTVAEYVDGTKSKGECIQVIDSLGRCADDIYVYIARCYQMNICCRLDSWIICAIRIQIKRIQRSWQQL